MCRVFVVGMLLAISHTVFAQAGVPGAVYRGDTRGPDVIFAQGFRPAGQNLNPLDHIAGASCSAAASPALRSGYVALSARSTDAMHHGLYVYRVMPDQFPADEDTAVYDVTPALGFVLSMGQVMGINLRQRTAIQALASTVADRDDMMARRIPREWIHSVDIYAFNASGQRIYQGTQANPHYVAPAQVGAQAVFSHPMTEAIRNAPLPANATQAAAADGTTVSVCMLPSDSCGGGPMARGMTLFPQAAVNSLTCMRKPLLRPGDKWSQALFLILD